jgi:hypothetical protein
MGRLYFAAFIPACLLFTHVASAQLVQFPAGNAAWTLVFTYSDDAATQPPQSPAQKPPATRKARKIDVTRAGNLQRVLITWTDGKTSERWTVPDLPAVFEEDPRNGNVGSIQSGSREEKITEFTLTYDSSAFDWIKPEFLQEKDPVSYRGKQCFHYKGSVPMVSMGVEAKPITFLKEAWIDSKTLLPLALATDGASICVFTFQPTPPSGSLAPPPKFASEIAYYKRVTGFR